MIQCLFEFHFWSRNNYIEEGIRENEDVRTYGDEDRGNLIKSRLLKDDVIV